MYNKRKRTHTRRNERINVVIAAPFIGYTQNAASEGQIHSTEKERARNKLDGYHYELTTTTTTTMMPARVQALSHSLDLYHLVYANVYKMNMENEIEK